MRSLALLSAVLVLCLPAAAQRRGDAFIRNLDANGGKQSFDLDGDGDTDWAIVGDWDADGDLDEEDIEAAIDLVGETGDGGVVQLVAGTFVLDQDNDSVGESYCVQTNSRNPHVCLPSNVTLMGAGRDQTILQLAVQGGARPMGAAPLIGVNIDGGTYDESTTRVTDIHVRDLTVRTQGTCDEGSNVAAPGILIWDCDQCSVENVKVENTAQAAIHFARNTNTWGRHIYAKDVGNYDDDGSATGGANCDPGFTQPCLYNFSSDGVVARNVGYRDSYCEDVGGDALNWRVDGWVKRAGPFGENSLNFATATKAFIAQVFDTGANTGGTGTTVSDVVVFLRKVGGGTPSDVVEVAIETTTGSPSEPTGTAVSGLDFSDFETYDATVLGNGFTAVRFRRTSASPTRLTENTDYALVVKHDDTTNAVAVQYDSNSGTDTYTDGDAWVSQTGASSSWTQQSNQDLNFFIANGSLEAPFIKNVHIKDGDGSCANLRATFSGNLSGLTCENTQAVKVGEADMMLNSVVNGFSVTNTNGSTESSAGFRVGSYWLGGTISNGSVDGTPDGAPCLFLVAWSRDATFQMMNLSNCGDEGVESKGGTRRIVMNDVNISGADADAYLFTTNADSDGVDGGDHDWLISGGIVRGVNDSGIFAGGGVQLERLTVQGVSFQNVGKYCFEGEISTGSINRMRLLNNTFKGWGEDGTGQQLRCVELDGTWNDVDIIGNTFESLGNNESHGIVYDMAAGDDLLVMGNRCHGTFSSDCFIGIQTASREYIFIGNDWNGQAWNDAASPALLKIRSDGTIAFGDSNVDRPDVRLFRHAADIVGVDSGDCLAIGGSGATQATWCQSDTAPAGACSPDGALFSDTAGADSGLYVCENGTWSAKK